MTLYYKIDIFVFRLYSIKGFTVLSKYRLARNDNRDQSNDLLRVFFKIYYSLNDFISFMKVNSNYRHWNKVLQ